MEQPPQAENRNNRPGKIAAVIGYAKKLSWFISACAALLLFFVIRKFFFDVVRVNNYDMDNTYHYGDAILVKKRFNTFYRGDIVLLEYPPPDEQSDGTCFFQRIVALPGDSLMLTAKRVTINDSLLEDVLTVKHNYVITSATPQLDSLFMVTHKLTEGGPVSDAYDYSFSLTREQAEQLERLPQIKSVRLKSEAPLSYDEACFPGHPMFTWNRDCYGKIYVPKKNDTLHLDTLTINLYSEIIGEYENNQLETRQDSIFINGQLSTTYVVKRNYYFTLGDNRDNANDSRVWGYLPEHKIIGKAIRRIKRSRR